MKNIFAWLIIFATSIGGLSAQQGKGRLQLLSSTSSRILNLETGHTITYRPVYEHNGSTLSADSGYYYTDDLQREFFDAYGNIVITQPNGVVIYANKLNYAAETQLAILTNNVRMVDKQTVLTTNYLTYNMNRDVGTYTGGGRITNVTDTITSRNAWYFNSTQDAYFRYDVVVRTPDVQIFTDTMRYNTAEKVSYFYGATNMKGKNGENLYTEEGFYNTESELAQFYKQNLYTEGSRFLKGDTLFYDGKTGIGRAFGHVVFIDTADQAFLEGGRGVYRQEDESIVMTEKPLVTMVTQKDSVSGEDLARTDSIYLTADTLFSTMILLRDYVPLTFNWDRQGGELDAGEEENFVEEPPLDELAPSEAITPGDTLQVTPDSIAVDTTLVQADTVTLQKIPPEEIQKELVADSTLREQSLIPQGNEVDSLMHQAVASLASDSVSQDTSRTRIIKAYRNVRLFKSDLQSVADSAYYGYPDSMLRLYGAPMIWTQGSQLSGDSVFLQIKNEKLDNMIIDGRAFTVMEGKLDTTKYSQIKGRQIRSFFVNDELERVFVDGNAESLVYMENEEKSAYSDVHHNRSGRIKLLFSENELSDFIPIRSAEGTIYPLNLTTRDQEFLEGFIWKPGDRPTSKEDLLNRKRAVDNPIPSEDAVEAPPTPADTAGSDSEPGLAQLGLQKIRHFLHRYTSVADRGFFFHGHLGEGLIVALRHEKRIVAKSLAS